MSASPFQPYYDIMAYADKRLAEATDAQIGHCYNLTMEDTGDIANKIRSERFRRIEAQRSKRQHS